MKRLLPLLLLLCSLPSWAAAPSILQHKSGFATAASTVTVTLTSNVTAGNMLLVFVGGGGTGVTVNTPTMTGETLVKVTGASNTNANGQAQCYAVNSAVGGHNAVTATTTGNLDDIHLHVIEVAGQSASPQDATGNTSSATASVSTSGSTTTATDLVLAFFFDNANNRTMAAGTGYAIVEQTNNTTGGDAGISVSKTVSATGTQTATITGNSTDTLQQGIIAIAGSSGGVTKNCTIALMGAGPC